MSKFFSLSLSYQDRVLNDIPIDKSGFSLSLLVGAKGKHATQSCKLKVQSRDAMKFIIEAEDYIFAKVYQSEVVVFEGVIKPYVAVSASQTTIDSMNIDILDYTELLDKYVFMDLSKFGGTNPSDAVIAQKWKSETVEHILRALFALAGVTPLCTIEFESAAGLSKRFDDFRIVDGDVLSDVISNLCYECCLDFRFGVGKVIVYPTDVFDPVATITDYRLKARANRARVKDDGFKLSYQTFTTKRIKIYHEDNRFDEQAWGTIATWEPKKGYYYNKEMHSEDGAQPPTKYTAMWSFKEIEKAEGEDAKITVVDVLDAEVVPSLHDEKGVDITAHLDSYDETGGCAYIAYDGEFNWQFGKGWGFEYTVYANVSYKKEHENPYAVGLKPKKIALKYLDDFDSANHFGETYQTREKQSALTYDFTSSNVLIPGKCYTFKEDTVMGLSSVVRILSSSYDYETKLYHYTAEGANKMAVIPLQPMPTESDDLYPSIPPEQAQFFYLTCDRTLFLVEESNESVKVVAHGFATDQATSLTWIVNGHFQDTEAKSIDVPVSELQMGQNAITCRIVVETVPYERTVKVIKTQTNENAIIQYRYGNDPQNPPYTEGGVWFWNGKALFLKHKVFGNMNSEAWTVGIPPKTADAPYLWMRVSTDGGSTWTYTRLHASDDITFDIVADATVYPWSVRGATIAVTNINLSVTKQNTIAPCTWTTVPKIAEPVVNDEFKLTIPVGFEPKELKVIATIDGVGQKSIILTAYDVGSKNPVYIGDAYTYEQLIALPQNPMGFPWIEGDHALVIERKDGKEDPVPYVWHKAVAEGESHWKMLETSDKNISQVMRNALYDVVDHGSMDMSCTAVHGFFERLAAVDAFIENLQSQNVLIEDPNNPNGMSVQIATKGKDGKTVYIVKYGTTTIFQIDPGSGRVFFGQPNDGLTEPVSGFMYRPTSAGGEIIGPNGYMKLTSTGSLYAKHAQFDGSATITSGTFKGQFDCGSIRTDFRATKAIRQSTSRSDGHQVADFIERHYPDIFIRDGETHETGFIECSLVGGSADIKYMRMSYTMSGGGGLLIAYSFLVFYDKDHREVPCSRYGINYTHDMDSHSSNDLMSIDTYTPKMQLWATSGAWLPSGLTVDIYEGGNILRLTVLEAPAQSVIDAMPYGQIYADGNGNLKMSIKNR